MNRIDNLTLRTTNALGRLASLQRRADKTGPPAGLVRDALEELNSALEELRVANEALSDQAAEVLRARDNGDESKRDLERLFATLPIPCLFTESDGRILDANPQASQLLNVGRQHLAGKPLLLFFMDRDLVTRGLDSLPETGEFVYATIIRPRERRPREVLVRVVRLLTRDRCCWFLDRVPAPTESGND